MSICFKDKNMRKKEMAYDVEGSLWHQETGKVKAITVMFDGYYKFDGCSGVKRLIFDPKPKDIDELIEVLKDYGFVFIGEFGDLAKSLYL